MVHGHPRAPHGAPALVRELSRLQALNAPPSKKGFSEGLSHWLDWTHAISLSGALGTAASPGAPAAAVDAAQATAEFERVAAGLRSLIARLGEPAAPPREGRPPLARGPRAAPAPVPAADFATYRQHYQTAQQAMETRIDTLRQRLRAWLAASGAEGARLAALDAVMAQALGEREQVLLAGVARRLEPHYERLRRAEPPPADGAAGTPPAPRWPTVFIQDLRAVLQAELDTRLLPAAGLLDALRAVSVIHHA